MSPSDLDHQVGLHWNSSSPCSQSCIKYVIANLPNAYKSKDLHDAVIADAYNRDEVKNYLKYIDVIETTKLFGPWSYSGLVDFDSDTDLNDADMHNSFGHAAVVCEYKIRIKNRGGEVQQLIFSSGTIKDLYDFNYKLGGASRRAAIVQSGFDTLGLAAGKVFKNEAGFSGEVILPNGE